VTAAMGLLLRPILQASAQARFLALGSLGALLGPCATFPMDRVFTFAGVGAFGLFGLLLLTHADGWRRRAAVALAAWHGPVAAAALVLRVCAGPAFGWIFAEGEAAAPRDAAVSEQTLVFLSGTEFATVYTPVIRLVRGDAPAPRRVHMLSSQLQDNELLREDEHTLVIAPAGGFLSVPLTGLMRDPGTRFDVGQTIERTDFTAEVRATTEDGRPSVVAFHFRTPLEDPGLRFLVATARGFEVWEPPPVGGRERVPWTLPGGSLRERLPGDVP